uniref:Small ribosomal subunit protein uS15m n=1 Tax=Trichuris muris TaxID=70415 RepID=A0A5S6QDT8_TRIMR
MFYASWLRSCSGLHVGGQIDHTSLHCTLPTMRYQAMYVQSRSLVVCCMRPGRFKWYNIRKPAADSRQAEPEYFEKQALALEPAPGYIDKLGAIWLEMVSVGRDVSFKRDDFFIQRDVKRWLPELDVEKPRAEYEYVKALKSAPETVQKIFSVQYGHRKDSTFLWKRMLISLVQQHDLDNESLEARIARHTALIRHWTTLLMQMKSKPGWLRQSIYISINHRRKLLRLLREQNVASFKSVLERLKIAYYTPPLPEDARPMTRKAWVEFIVRKKMELVKEERLRRYHEELKERQQKFLETKDHLFEDYEVEERKLRSELAVIRIEEENELEVVGKALDDTIDQVTESTMLQYYYLPRRIDPENLLPG